MTRDDGTFYDNRPDEQDGSRCLDDDHSGCPHVPFGYALTQVDRDSHWPRDLDERLGLCRCDCHRDCPLAAGGLALDEWLSHCTCNGALQMIDRRRRLPPTSSSRPHTVNLFAGIGPSIEKVRRKKRARRAAQQRRTELTVEAVERIVQEEWRRQGLDVPQPAIARRIADEIVDPPGVVERAGRQARLYRDLAGLPLRLRRVTRGGISETLERFGRKMEGAFIVATGQRVSEVPLNAEAVGQIDQVRGRAVFLPSTMTATWIEARLAADGRVELWPYPRAGPSDRAFGVLPADEDGRLLELISIATRVDQPCICLAAFVRIRDGRWQLFVNRPLERIA